MSGLPHPPRLQIYYKTEPHHAWNTKDVIEVQFNPKELTFERAPDAPATSGAGLDTPNRQASRPSPEGEKLSLELFFDTTGDGMGSVAKAVTEKTDRVYALIKPTSPGHAPPICLVVFGDNFPGSNMPVDQANLKRYGFACIVKSIRQTFTLFSSAGVPLRATLSLSLAEYVDPATQAARRNQHSPDRTHGHVLQRREALWQVAARYYDRAGEWRAIAVHNGMDDPRRLVPGRMLTVPPIR
jgi:hypothetical protein